MRSAKHKNFPGVGVLISWNGYGFHSHWVFQASSEAGDCLDLIATLSSIFQG